MVQLFIIRCAKNIEMFSNVRKLLNVISLRSLSKLLVPDLDNMLPKIQVVKLPESSQVIDKVNSYISENRNDRLFAVVQLCGKQFKVTNNDLIVVEGTFPPTIGDRIKLEKVLCAGGKCFSLIGRPMVQRDLVQIHATIIEKTLSNTKIVFRKKRRKRYMRTNFARCERTMLRINSIEMNGQVNDPPDVTVMPERI